ncbi:potassium/proton antiporter [Rubrivirga sp. S365]|uniref:potassium/proton antiporter n=1 Tax=Rubrivirga sp. S365 TaxID=3076080 RepID=UPI0028CA4E3B|nr:potassium/proton antiporter [Rubrivirga sp. S365]MDT7858395.1 potassium/proton antiporter [Rubrivirga sp. S365]
MPSVNAVLFVAGLLLLFGIVSSKLSARIGMPVLVLFLGVGMLAGSEGLGGVAFEDYELANALGSVALAFILFDGGLRTSTGALRSAWRPALSLATVGVLVTAAVTGLAAAYVLGLSTVHGLLLGAIVGSTDAAAVFSVLRSSGLALPERLGATLEVESGSNDPMAIFLTLGLVGVLTGTAASAGSLALLFALQFGVGAAAGVGVGKGAAWAVERVQLDAPGLYPVLVTAFGLLAFGLAAVLGGSGFLAVYLAGIVLGNSPIVFRRGIFMFHDAVAWLAQIALFVLLGLLSFPSRLLAVAGPALAVAVVLIVVARPLAVALSLAPFRFTLREGAFVSWVGLKGAVPITLATFPLLAGVDGAEALFDVVFFVVLVSAVSQGWSLPVAARWLEIGRPADPAPPVTVELHALRHVDGDVVDYTVAPSARVAGQMLRDLVLPDGVAVTLVVRDGAVVVPRGGTALRTGDHVFVVARTQLKPLVDRLFDPEARTPPLAPGLTLAFPAETTLGQLHRFFGLPGPTWSTDTVGDLLADAGASDHLGCFHVAHAGDPEFVQVTYAPQEAPVGEAPETVSAGPPGE